MTDITSRFIHMENWIFEVKSVRAIRVDNYGEPYSAISNFTLNGDIANIDSLITKENEEFTRKDYQVFYRLCQHLGINEVQFSRFKNDTFKKSSFNIAPLVQKTQLSAIA